MEFRIVRNEVFGGGYLIRKSSGETPRALTGHYTLERYAQEAIDEYLKKVEIKKEIKAEEQKIEVKPESKPESKPKKVPAKKTPAKKEKKK